MENRRHERITAIDYRQYLRARWLVHECCNYDNGQCIVPDEGDGTHAYGRYRNVFLSSAELAELQTELPSLWEQYIERLSEYMESSGKGYKTHAATIRRWANADKKKEEPPARNRDYSVEEGETI